MPGASVPVKARVTTGSADISSVVFKPDGTTIATKSSSPWETTWTAAGEGVAYHDESTGNTRSSFRSGEDVDVADGGTGRIVSSTRAGEWLKYTVSTAAEQAYSVAIAVANGSSEGSFHLELDGEDITGTMSGSTAATTPGRS